MFLKVCGITRKEDALAAARAGFDAVGMVFAPGPRQISPETARAITGALPPGLLAVGVFVNEEVEEVERMMRFCRLDLAQFHGEEDPALVARFGDRAIKAVRTAPDLDPEELDAYRGCFAILLDAFHPTLRGGTGTLADWKAAAMIASRQRVILAGGLTPTLAARAALVVRPFGLDVSSGVERERGIKDHAKLQAFVMAARNAGGELLREGEVAR
jgi:phosphoribosylanthranilate isomerase